MEHINPHYFAAILDGVPHRFVLVIESESVIDADGDFAPPRFSVGAINAMRDPRFSSVRQLLEVGVTETALHIPSNWLMAHQYIYIIHDNTDAYGWQYRSQWPPYGPPGPKDEQWSKVMKQNSLVRRRIWMTTIVPRLDLVRVKRLLSENVRIDRGKIKLEGELMRYEKGALTKTWHKRKVVLLHDRIEFYSADVKKGEVSLNDCEVRMLFENQCPGKKYAFSVRNGTGSVGILLDAENKEARRDWVLAIQYQMTLNNPDMNNVPLEYGPPTGEYPDNRVCVCSDLKMRDKDGKDWLPRHFQLLPREVVYYDDDQLKGRIFVEEATVVPEERSNNFSVTSASGITFNLSSDNPETKALWVNGVRRVVQGIESHKMMLKTMPKEEAQEPACTPVERISQFYDDNWTAPAVEGEDEEYLDNVFKAPYRNNPSHYEFSEELGINLDPRLKAPLASPKTPTAPSPPIQTSDKVEEEEPPVRALTTIKSTKSFLNVFQPQVKLLHPKRALINPRFMLSALKGVTHRFVLVLECEHRKGASKEVFDFAPPRFTVGGLRASKDPRTVPLDQLIRISNKSPEVQLPSGWFTLHPYVYITQQNTDDDGWQYRSNWSNGTLAPEDEQWVDTCEEEKQVRRRLWMVTVVKRDDLIKAKTLATDELAKSDLNEPILQETMLVYVPELSSSGDPWQRRKILLHHDKLEFYNGNEKKGEVKLGDCDVDMLIGKDDMNREHAFALAHPNGSVKVIFDAESREMRLRWVKAITYQLAIITPDLNFQPFLFGPPTGELPEQRVLLGSNLEVLNVTDNSWEEYQVHLLEYCLQCYNRDALSGRILIDGAQIKSGDGEAAFVVKIANLTATFRAKNEEEKFAWMRAIKRQVQQIEFNKVKFASSNNGLGESNRNLSSRDKGKYFYDPEWVSQELEHREDDDYLKLLREKYEGNLKQFWIQSSSSSSSRVTTTTVQTIPRVSPSFKSDYSIDTYIDRKLDSMSADSHSVSTTSGSASTKTMNYNTGGSSVTMSGSTTTAVRTFTQQSVTSQSSTSTNVTKRYDALEGIPEKGNEETSRLHKNRLESAKPTNGRLHPLQTFKSNPSHRLRLPSEIVGENLLLGEDSETESQKSDVEEQKRKSKDALRALSLSSDADDIRPKKSITREVDRDWLRSSDEDEDRTETAPLAVPMNTLTISSLKIAAGHGHGEGHSEMDDAQAQKRMDRFAQPNIFSASSNEVTKEELISPIKSLGQLESPMHQSKVHSSTTSTTISNQEAKNQLEVVTQGFKPAVESTRAGTLEAALLTVNLRPASRTPSRAPSRQGSNNSLLDPSKSQAGDADDNETVASNSSAGSKALAVSEFDHRSLKVDSAQSVTSFATAMSTSSKTVASNNVVSTTATMSTTSKVVVNSTHSSTATSNTTQTSSQQSKIIINARSQQQVQQVEEEKRGPNFLLPPRGGAGRNSFMSHTDEMTAMEQAMLENDPTNKRDNLNKTGLLEADSDDYLIHQNERARRGKGGEVLGPVALNHVEASKPEVISPRAGTMEAAILSVNLRPVSSRPATPSSRPPSRSGSSNNLTNLEESPKELKPSSLENIQAPTPQRPVRSPRAADVKEDVLTPKEHVALNRPSLPLRGKSSYDVHKEESSETPTARFSLPPRGLSTRKNSFQTHKEQQAAMEQSQIDNDLLTKRELLRKTGLLEPDFDALSEAEQAALIHVYEKSKIQQSGTASNDPAVSPLLQQVKLRKVDKEGNEIQVNETSPDDKPHSAELTSPAGTPAMSRSNSFTLSQEDAKSDVAGRESDSDSAVGTPLFSRQLTRKNSFQAHVEQQAAMEQSSIANDPTSKKDYLRKPNLLEADNNLSDAERALVHVKEKSQKQSQVLEPTAYSRPPLSRTNSRINMADEQIEEQPSPAVAANASYVSNLFPAMDEDGDTRTEVSGSKPVQTVVETASPSAALLVARAEKMESMTAISVVSSTSSTSNVAHTSSVVTSSNVTHSTSTMSSSTKFLSTSTSTISATTSSTSTVQSSESSLSRVEHVEMATSEAEAQRQQVKLKAVQKDADDEAPITPTPILLRGQSMRKASFQITRDAAEIYNPDEDPLAVKDNLRKTGYIDLEKQYQHLTVAERAALRHVVPEHRASITANDPHHLSPLQMVKLRSASNKDSHELGEGEHDEHGDIHSPFKQVKLRHVERDSSTHSEDHGEKVAPFLKMVKLRSVNKSQRLPSTDSPTIFKTKSEDEEREAAAAAVKAKIMKFERPSLSSQKSMNRAASFKRINSISGMPQKEEEDEEGER